MHLRITFENSDSNLKFIERDLIIICEVNAYVETNDQETWDVRPPLIPYVFLNEVTGIKSLALYKNKGTDHVGVSADLNLLDEGMCSCEFTVSEVKEVNNFPTIQKVKLLRQIPVRLNKTASKPQKTKTP